MRCKLFLPLILIFISQSLQAQKATITLEKKDILTYPYDDPDPVPALAEGKEQMYPYYSFNGYSLTGKMQRWDVVKLENDYITVWVLPAAGGKVWGAIEKSTGEEFIYRNEVMKFRNISMRGPWTSGGIEFNFGIIGHSPSTCVPVDYRMAENEDGSVSCIVGNMDLPSGTRWNVEVKLQKDKAYFETNATWINPTALPQTYYVWMTAAAAVSDDLEFFYPGNAEIGHGGEYGLWPVNKEGRNVAWYKENNFGPSKSYHVVGEYNDFMGGYYHRKDFGFGHWALYDEMPGHKLWLWSLARDGGIWEDLLTDTDGQYMEFQAGRMFNQYGGTSAFKTPITQTPFPPDLTDSWHEIWFPVKGTGGISDVSPYGAMHVQNENGKLRIAINAFASATGRIEVRTGEAYVFDEQKDFRPMQVYDTIVDLRGRQEYEVTVGGMDLRYDPSSKKYIDRPFESSVNASPATASTYYQQGMQLKDMRKYSEAKSMFKKCLEADHLYVDAYAALAELCYRSMDYDSVFHCTEAAIQLDTYHPAANYIAGITYLATGDLTNALESLGWAARSPEYRSAAYEKMAVAEFRLNDLNLAEHYANASLDYNRKNLNSLQLLAILKSRAGKTKEAEEILRNIEDIDRTGHFSCYECHRLNPSDANLKRFTSSIDGEMPYQEYLDLSMYYNSLDLKDEALDILGMAPDHPIVSIWKAYLKEDPEMLRQISGMSPAFVFPHRNESVPALEWAAGHNNSWKFRYYLALNYAAINRMADCRRLLAECGQEPDYAPFYLARAAIMNDEKQMLPDLLKARQLDPSEWRTAVRLTNYYRLHEDHAAELKLASEAYSKNSSNSTLGIEYAVALINNRQYAKSLDMLGKMKILPNEGSSEGKRVFTQAALMLSMDLMEKGKYTEALKMIDKSEEWPENLGVGKPFDPDTRIQDYLRSYCLGKLKRNDQTDPAYIEKVRNWMEKNSSEVAGRALKITAK